MRTLISTLLITAALPTFAEQTISIYGGLQEATSSNVDVIDVDGSAYSFDADWEGLSLDQPPYYGVRYTNWAWGDIGVALEYTHTKVYSGYYTRKDTGFEVMEFTDGVNAFTASGIKRFAPIGRITPYAAAGMGFNMPHVELQSPLMTEDEANSEFQFGGFTATTFGGASYQLTDRISLLSELKVDYNQISADMGETGSFDTNFFTYAINFGATYSF